jgi:UDP-GlcNAc:undecaprenyl-phosphate GlcNAc-1-phosphate transferase
MTTALVAFAVAFIAAILCTTGVRAAAHRLGVVDKPDSFRKVHWREVPLLGGVAIYVAFATPIVTLCFFYRNAVSDLLYAQPIKLLTLMGGGAIALCLGIFDDVRNLPVRWKLLLQIVAACVAFAGGYAIRAISNPFGEPLVLGLWSFPVTLLWFLGCMNAVNLLDGLDGLAAGACLFATVTLLLVSIFFGNVMSMLMMACLSGAILGFLLFNFHPATIFLGDSGSMLLGYVVAALAILAAHKSEATVALLIPVIALGLPIFDTALSIVRRWLRRLPISAADRQHVHHILLSMGLSHQRAVLVLYGACVVLGGAAVLVAVGRNETTFMVVGALGIIAFVCVRVFGCLRFGALWGRLSEDRDRSHRSAEAKVAVENAGRRMQAAADIEAMWAACSDAFKSLELDHATFRLNGHEGSEPLVWTWSNGLAQQAHAQTGPPPGGDNDETGSQSVQLDSHVVQLGIRNNGNLWGDLELRKHVDSSPMLPVVPELLANLRDQMAQKTDLLLIP